MIKPLAHNLVLLQHELLMSLGVTNAPEGTWATFAATAIKALNLRCVYLLEKDNPIFGLEIATYKAPRVAADISHYHDLHKYHGDDFPETSEFIEEVVTSRHYWYCFSLKNLGYIIFEGRGKALDTSVIEALVAPTSRFAQMYTSRKQYLLNEAHRTHIKGISDRVQSEKYRLEHIFRTIKDSVLVLDCDGLVYFANLAVFHLFGLDEDYLLD